MKVRFDVRGDPQTKGSMVAFRHAITGRAHAKASNRKVERAWRAVVRLAADRAWKRRPTENPVGVHLIFRLRRPKDHWCTGKNAGKVRPKYRKAWPTAKRDLDKLERSILDALTGIIYDDDGQVCRFQAEKVYADDDRPGVQVEVWEL